MTAGRAFSILLVTLAVLLGSSGKARAQAGRPIAAGVGTTAAPAAPATQEEEAVDSPRVSMRTFLDLCDRGRFEEAAHYLDVPKGSEKRAAELAQHVDEVLEARLWVDPERLSPRAQGKKEDALPAGTEELGKIDDVKGHPTSIRIVRHESHSAEDEPRWVFSQASVLALDTAYASLRGRWARDHLPTPLLEQGPMSLYYWQWLALPLLTIVCIGVGRLLTSISDAIARGFTAKWTWGPRLVRRLGRPATMGWALGLFWLALPYLALTIRAEDLVERLARALGYLAFFWALFRTVTIAGDEVADAQWAAAKPNIRAITGVGVRLGKLVVAALALMVALSQLGYPVTTVIAGLGIGGVALALAAQKTVENLFGSISILIDQPFNVGDTIRVDTVEGTVETIGLRSTRMRTIERTLIIIPNGKLADMRIESLGPRDRIRFSTKLALARDTELAKVEHIIGKVAEKLRSHASVHEQDVSVRFTGFGEWSFDVEVSAPIETTDAAQFAAIREELLLACLRIVEKEGARLAVPTRQLLSPSVSATTRSA
jgi:MscS family membrane protein